MKTRTRFAPSPTGMMHIGNLRTAIYAYLVAKHEDGDFILRIEDTDQNRQVDGAIEFIYNTLKICGMTIDEGPNNEGEVGPYLQSERKDLYKKYALELVEKGSAYYCFCDEERLCHLREVAENSKVPFMYDGCCKKLTKEEIEQKISNGDLYVIRQMMPKDGETTITDEIYGKITIQNDTLEDQILLKSDGYPTYNFANVIDDHLMGITHVIRGKEYLSQTAKYNLLYDTFGWEYPKYIHVSMVLGEDGTKLSKRNGDASFMDLYNDGYLAPAIINYLVLLGWCPPDNKEILSMEELIKLFDYHKINKASSEYDRKKLDWVNAHYIKALSDEEYIDFVKPFLSASYDLSNKSNEWINKLLLIYKDHISYGKEIVSLVEMFFNNKITIDEDCLSFINSDPCISNVLEVFKEEITKVTDWTIENINNVINNTKEKSCIKGKLLYMPIRIKTTGIMHGPELPDTLYLLGKETVLKRLNS